MAAATHPVPTAVRRWLTRAAPAASDADLVRRFAAARDEAAFAALVDRHGPMVLGVARRAAGDHHAAEDVFQATFLALACRAGRLRRPEALPAWLHRTAYHLGLNAARTRTRRERAEAGHTAPPPPTGDELSARELLTALDEELARLPEAERVPLVLCCLEGLTQDEAAARLGWTPGSVRGRLERGRRRLRDRLARRGLAFAAGVALLQAPPGVSATLHDAAVRAAAGGAASPAVAALANEAPGAGFRLGWAAVGVLAGGLVFGVGAVMMTLPADPPAVAPPPRPAEPEPARPVARLGWSPHRIGNAAFALTADEKEIVTVSPEGIVRRFDAATGKPLGQKQLTPRDDISTGSQAHARLSADGRTAAIQEWLGDEFFARSRVSVWDVPAGKLLFRRASDAGTRVGLFALSPDGRRLAVREDVGERTVLRAYDTATGAGKDVGELEYNVYDLQFSADGRRVVASQISARRGDGPREFLGCYDVVAGKEVWKRPGHCSQFAFSPDGRTVAFVAHGAPARTFHLIETDPATGAVTERDQGCGINTAHPNSPVAFAPDSRTLLSDYSDDLVSWDVTDAKEVGRIRKPDGYGGGYGPMLGAFSRDGKTVVTNWGSLQRWDLTTGKPLFDAPPGDGLRGPVEHVAFTPDGREVVAWGWGLDSGRWEVASGKRAAYRRERFGFQLVATPAGLRSVHCDHQNRAAHRVTIHDPVAGAAVETVQWTSEKEVGINGIRAYALAADGHTLLMAHGDEPRAGGKTYVTAHDIPTGRRLARFGVPGHLYFGQSPFSPCGRWVVLAGKVYHTHTGTELFTPAAREGERLKPGGRMADGPVWFSADGRLLAGRLAGTDGRGSGGDLAVWELASGKVLARLPRGGRAGQVVFGPDGRTVALADARGVAAHDLLTGRPMAGFPAPDITPESNNERGAGAQTVAFAPDGRTLATGHSDGSVAVWAVPRPAPAEAVADLWAGLGAESPAVGRAAVDAAVRDPAAAVKLLAANFRPPADPAAPADPPEVAALIGRLDADEFDDREDATRKLRALGAKAERPLRRALAAGPSAEARRRIEGLLGAGVPAAIQTLPVSGEVLRGVRAVEVLERVGTAEARNLLARWAAQGADARLAAEADAALARLGPGRK